MNVPSNIVQLIAISALLVLLSSCVRDDLRNLDTSDWNPSLAVPLIDTRYEVEDFLLSEANEDGFLNSDSSGLVELTYKGQIASISGAELFELPTVPFLNKDSIVVIDLSSNEHDFREVHLDEGNLNVNVTYTSLNQATLDLSIPGLFINGQAYSESIVVPSSGGTQTNRNFLIDLSNSYINLQLVSGRSNAFEIVASAERNAPGLTFLFQSISGLLQNAEFSKFKGIFGEVSLASSVDTVRLDLFKNWTGGQITFVNPKIALNFVNSFGLPVGVRLDSLEFNDEASDVILSGQITQDTIEIEHPESEGQVAETLVNVDVTNSAITNALSFGPALFGFDLSLFTLPAEDTVNSDFVLAESDLVIEADLVLPMHGSIDQVEVTDTFILDIDELSFVEEADLRLVTDNGLAADLSLQIYFLDDQFQEIDSLFAGETMILSSATTDADGTAIAETRQISRINLTNNRLENFYAAELMLVRARVNTTNATQPIIKIHEDNELVIQLGAIFKGQL